ncbi:DUF6477 family protein [Tropicimonas sp. IMCC34043]|uniref:DUF6477 family protein n=1 Tax=Tropicimonas sp. IMCC34043 TaxID=2248760 RepID=UPI000E251617|nr:DUF6477 family protein [Tropicimonas sp. IMCC34043]
MTDFLQTLTNLRRPRLLIRAARYGLSDYNRRRDLKRITLGTELPAPEKALRQLLDLEADLEICRREGLATYSVVRHVDILIALMAEARLILRRPATA